MTDAAPIQNASDLTRYIETRYHQTHREQLPVLAELAAKVERVHAGHERAPKGLRELLRQMIGELEVHMKKEELILFPAIRAGGTPGLAHPIAVMRADHDDHGRAIAAIAQLTYNLELPEGACGTWTRLYAGLAEFITDLTSHIRLENEVLFPQFDQVNHTDT
ncbi:hemerythrin HHE cation binding domain protein [Hyphomonas neptunium ATCC 15444]|uniref:Hemerythrin HHE cation binding domain protein n=2 Tax=Hyphomonas TaxID=85 RepID=Q0C1Z3_HYPNA|nr:MULTISPECIES: hemerythrin domain-containing protein [Hyphomonas]ABI78323.1 hemerythrin HHE cation binding domain protein [Hyphomonas neptunium ATCC 15444]KCZ93033.1 hemerythrin HHE cation binding domain-containing protein [Hyphomonas hirschiana VP5]